MLPSDNVRLHWILERHVDSEKTDLSTPLGVAFASFLTTHQTENASGQVNSSALSSTYFDFVWDHEDPFQEGLWEALGQPVPTKRTHLTAPNHSYPLFEVLRTPRDGVSIGISGDHDTRMVIHLLGCFLRHSASSYSVPDAQLTTSNMCPPLQTVRSRARVWTSDGEVLLLLSGSDDCDRESLGSSSSSASDYDCDLAACNGLVWMQVAQREERVLQIVLSSGDPKLSRCIIRPPIQDVVNRATRGLQQLCTSTIHKPLHTAHALIREDKIPQLERSVFSFFRTPALFFPAGEKSADQCLGTVSDRQSMSEDTFVYVVCRLPLLLYASLLERDCLTPGDARHLGSQIKCPQNLDTTQKMWDTAPLISELTKESRKIWLMRKPQLYRSMTEVVHDDKWGEVPFLNAPTNFNIEQHVADGWLRALQSGVQVFDAE